MHRSLAGSTLALLSLSAPLFAQDVGARRALLTPITSVPAPALAWDARQRADDDSIVDVRFVRIDVDALRATGRDGLVLDLFGESHALSITRTTRGRGHDLFFGELAGHDATVVIAVLDDGASAASFEYADRVFQMVYTGHADVHALQRFDRSRWTKECGCDHTHEVAQPRTGDEPQLDPNDASRTVIDVATFYTPSVRQAAGGTSAIQATLAMRIGVADQTAIDSGVDHELRLVYVAETNYNEAGNTSDLSRFRSTSDGFMDEVHTARDNYGADLMALITDTAGFCGVGYLMTNVSTGFASAAFSVTIDGCMPNHTLTHEMGHNMASHHDRANAGNAAYPYSYGWRTNDNVYRTVMSYSPGSRVPRWSGPAVTYQTYTMGTVNDDNHRSLNNVRAVVAAFRPSQVLYWCDIEASTAGSQGAPTLTGSGNVNLVERIRVSIGNSPAGRNGALFLGQTRIDFSIFGATVVPNPELVLAVTGSNNDIAVDVSAIRNIGSGSDMYFQAFFLDPTAPQGLSASDALKTTIP